jgi:hypothetical protein
MAEFSVTLVSRRKWVVVALAAGVITLILAALIGLCALPGLLFGSRLTAAEAEDSIRRHLVLRASAGFYERLGPGAKRADGLDARYHAEVMQPLNAIQFVSVDVNTVIFGAFSIRRSFVVEVIMRGQDGKEATRYYCFMDKYLTGECSRWNRLVAWW